jgi:hypothetical protein
MAVPGPIYRTLPRAPETWIIEHLCPIGGALNLYGSPKAGKSWLAVQLAAAVSNPEVHDWMSFPILTHGPVLYLQIDTPRSLWGLRMDQLDAIGMDLSNVYMADGETVAAADAFPFDIMGTHRDPVSNSWKWLREQVSHIQPILVVIDTLREIHSGDENASDQMHNVIAALRAATFPAAFLLLSHSRKENTTIPMDQRENLLDDNRGSSYISGRMDGIIKATSTTKHSYLTYQSRTVERAKLKCKRHEPGYWFIDESELDTQIRQVISDVTLTSTLAKAEALSTLSGKSLEACRSLIRRRANDPIGSHFNLATLREPESNLPDLDPME